MATYSSYSVAIDDSIPSPASPNVVVTFTYPTTLTFSEPYDNIVATINNVSYKAEGTGTGTNVFTVTIPLGSYPTVIDGILNLTSDMTGVSPTVDAISLYTVIPLVAQATAENEGDAVTASITIGSGPKSNGMIHVGLYTPPASTPPALTPAWIAPSDTSPIQVKTYTVFIDNFPPAISAADVAALIEKAVLSDPAFDSTTYDISSNGPTVTFSKKVASAVLLYIYIFDDNLIHRLGGLDYQDVVDEKGDLEYIPTPI
jgi:hypothetical protein